MTRTSIAGIAALLAVAGLLLAKGPTVEIRISGGDLAAPVAITDPDVMGRFQFGAGPGNFRMIDGQSVPIVIPQGFLVDWARGAVTPPEGLRTYAVTYELSIGGAPRLYVVRYGIDRSTGKGYVYFPGESDPAYAGNTSLFRRGVEGKWFHAWDAWEKVAHPLIANAAMAR